jgi:hypothetical protein
MDILKELLDNLFFALWNNIVSIFGIFCDQQEQKHKNE